MSKSVIMKSCCLLLAGWLLCAGAPVHAQESFDADDAFLDSYATSSDIPDPLEGFNRAMFTFNDVLLDYVAHPINTGYTYITPRFVRLGAKNAFHNALFPVRFVNNILQGKGRAAGVEMARFVVNTSVGFGGLFDVAKRNKPVVPVDEEDLGQTLGVWGVGEGCYIVLPLLGPSTARDTVGLIGDTFLDPITYIEPTSLSLVLNGGRTVNRLDDMLDTYDDLKRSAIEPYASFKNAYVQHRRAKVAK